MGLLKTYVLLLLWVGCVLHAKGQFAGNALDFDGIDDASYAAINPLFFPIGTSDFTVELWFKPRENDPHGVIFIQQRNPFHFATFNINKANYVFVAVTDAWTFTSTASIAPLTLGNWYHLAITYDVGAKALDFYIDGVWQGDESVTGGGYNASSGEITGIGARTAPYRYNFDGQIDEVRVWDTLRTQCDIAANMNTSLLGNEPGLVQYYKFDHGTAGMPNPGDTVIIDYAGSNDASMFNFALTGDSSNWVVSGARITKTGYQIPPSSINYDTISICRGGSHKFHDGKSVHNIQGKLTHLSHLSGAFACDSIIETTVNVYDLNTTVEVKNEVLTAQLIGVNYRWLNCDSNFTAIPGEVNQFFNPQVSGNYAVEIKAGNCIDTSTCHEVLLPGTGMNAELVFQNSIRVFPNPIATTFSFTTTLTVKQLILTDISGKLVHTIDLPSSPTDLSFILPGIYFVEFITDRGSIRKRVVKQ